jgi:hypothetical protein
MEDASPWMLRIKVRRIGWEAVHVTIDDCTRLGYAEVPSDELATTTASSSARPVDWFSAHGFRIRRVMTDCAKTYLSDAVQTERRRAGRRHVRIRRTMRRKHRGRSTGRRCYRRALGACQRVVNAKIMP